MNSVDEIKSSVISIDSKLTKMGSVVDGLVKRVEVVENSQQFISAGKAIHEKRKLLFPVYKKAKEAGKRVSFNKDKLFIDGEQTVVKSNELVKITRRDQSGDRMSDTSSGPGFSVAKKTPSVSSIKPSKSSVSDGSSSGSRFEVLADMHTGPD
ncbi:unnamed protein product [Mytilus edulis]|uniref:Uncharacterized protein n=1 Tax=Mytilus edulis TaxID=6550 RepID=A0A8S3QNV9_MYTED|nr:unnamed protein product [Mytilus edulis]